MNRRNGRPALKTYTNNSTFSLRAIKFLELYFGGALIKDAARVAGYKGTSDQALCNTGRKVLDKFSNNPHALFRRVGPRGMDNIVRLISGAVDDDSKPERQLEALKVLTQCFFP
jgi:hypothetical protein